MAIARAGTNDDLRVHRLPDSLFMHVGSSREFLDTVAPPRPAPPDAFNRGWLRMLNSVFDDDSIVAGRIVIESCWLSQTFTLPGDNILVGVPRECDSMIALPRNAGLACFPIGERDWTAITFGLDDDFKRHADSDGTFGNQRRLIAFRLPLAGWRSRSLVVARAALARRNRDRCRRSCDRPAHGPSAGRAARRPGERGRDHATHQSSPAA